MNVLFIEDDKKKIEAISTFIRSTFSDVKLCIKESYQSGLREIFTSTYDLLLLDMSMSTYEKSISEPGGFHEKFAGHLILREMFRKKRMIKTVLVTMFDIFPVDDNFISLEYLSKQLKDEFPGYFMGAIFYNGKNVQWQNELKHFILNR